MKCVGAWDKRLKTSERQSALDRELVGLQTQSVVFGDSRLRQKSAQNGLYNLV